MKKGVQWLWILTFVLIACTSGNPSSMANPSIKSEESSQTGVTMTIDNPLYELALKRRSVRSYGPAHIDDDIIHEIMKVALTAPSSFGHRPVEFVVVRDKAMIQKIGASKRMGGSQIDGADAVVVVMVKTANERAAEFWIEDGAIASAYLLLAAEQYNLGACWVHIRNRMGQKESSDIEIRRLLQIPDGYTVLNLVAMGEKGENKRPYTESDLPKDHIHYNHF